MRRGSEPWEEFGLVVERSIRGVAHVFKNERNGVSPKSPVSSEVVTANILDHDIKWLFKLFYANNFFVFGVDDVDHVKEE